MRQKVAICCAYLHEPKAILSMSRTPGSTRAESARCRFDRHARRVGAAVIVSSHLLTLVEDLCPTCSSSTAGAAMFLRPCRRSAHRVRGAEGERRSRNCLQATETAT